MRRKRKKSVIGFFYAHTWDPFSKYISPSTLRKMKITRAVHESSEKLSPHEKRKWAQLFTNIAKGYPRSWKKYYFYYKTHPLMPQSEKEYKISYGRMLRGSRVKSMIEPGVKKEQYIHLFPRFFSWYVRDVERTKRLFDVLEKMRGEKIAVFHGLDHLNLMVEETRSRNIPLKTYVLGGVPVFLKGTPLMHVPLLEAYTRYSFGRGRLNEKILNELRIKSELSDIVIGTLFKEFLELRKHPTAVYYIASFITDEVRKNMKKLSSIEFREKLQEYICSPSFKSMMSEKNLFMLGSLLPNKRIQGVKDNG